MKKSRRIKVISLGDTETGKSCLIKRYCEKRFISKYLPTIGVDFGVTRVKVDDVELQINLFDLSGNQAFKEVRNEFYKDTQAVMMVYDVTNKPSFTALDQWMNEIKLYIPDPSDTNKIIFILFANKIDNSNSRAVSYEQGQSWAQDHGCYYFETSAFSGDGVIKAFQMMFKGITDVLETGCRPKLEQKTLAYTKEQVNAINKLLSAKDDYSCLNVSPGCSKEDINKTYRKFARLLHPDKCMAPNTEDAFKKLTAAKETLLKLAK